MSGAIKLKRRRYEEAASIFTSAMDVVHDSARAHPAWAPRKPASWDDCTVSMWERVLFDTFTECLISRSACHLKLRNWSQAKSDIDKAAGLDPSFKTLVRKGEVLIEIADSAELSSQWEWKRPLLLEAHDAL